MSEDIHHLKEAEKEENGHYEERPRAGGHHRNSWGAGIALIVLGFVFLLANVTNFELENWWALFILIPAVANFNDAWRNYRRHGRFTRSSRHPLLWGLVFTVVSLTFLFSLDWSLIWPVFLIIGGIGALMGAWLD